jgi:hypothetical protein
LTLLNIVVLGALPVSGLAVAVLAQQQGWGLLQRYPLPLAVTLGVPYLLAKLICAAIVFAVWTYPAQRRLVFRRAVPAV